LGGVENRIHSQIEETIQRKVLGSELSPSHWKLKYTNVKDAAPQIDAVQVRNNVVRCFMAKIDPIIEAAVPENNNNTRSKLILALAKYRDGMRILTAHRSLDQEEKLLFQDCMDDFFELWVELFGVEGVSNYIHLFGAGHMLYFLEMYDCLYLYSQQGWEDLNNRCQAFIHQNSARGDYGSGEGKGKSYVFPLVRYIMRDLLWKTGEAERFYLDYYKEVSTD